jgi:hypothetical protein
MMYTSSPLLPSSSSHRGVLGPLEVHPPSFAGSREVEGAVAARECVEEALERRRSKWGWRFEEEEEEEVEGLM